MSRAIGICDCCMRKRAPQAIGRTLTSTIRRLKRMKSLPVSRSLITDFATLSVFQRELLLRLELDAALLQGDLHAFPIDILVKGVAHFLIDLERRTSNGVCLIRIQKLLREFPCRGGSRKPKSSDSILQPILSSSDNSLASTNQKSAPF